MDMEKRIQVLEDREKIKELRATYCFLIDNGNMPSSSMTILPKMPTAIFAFA